MSEELWIVAMRLEAAAVGGLPAQTGVGPRRAARAARRLLRRGPPGAMLNLGVAGGLDPALRAGDVVLVDGWVDGPRADRDLIRALGERLRAGGVAYRVGRALTVARPLWRPDQKRAAGLETDAAVCEMEGAAVAAGFAAAGVPVAGLRVVVDPVDRVLERPPGPLPELPLALVSLRRAARALRQASAPWASSRRSAGT